MIKKELFLENENEFTVESTSWVPTLYFRMSKDGFNYNIIEISIAAEIKATFGDKAYLGVFIGEEEKPRIVVETDLPYYWVRKGVASTWDLPFGKHEVTIALKSDKGNPCGQRQLDFYISRFFDMKELLGFIIPISILGES